MPLFDFRCDLGHIHEAIRSTGATVNCCPTCGQDAQRIYSRPAALTHREPDTRGMFRRFSEASAELDHHGVDTSGAWKQAKRTADAMIRAGENPVRSIS